jgi:hypothetical protein
MPIARWHDDYKSRRRNYQKWDDSAESTGIAPSLHRKAKPDSTTCLIWMYPIEARNDDPVFSRKSGEVNEKFE